MSALADPAVQIESLRDRAERVAQLVRFDPGCAQRSISAARGSLADRRWDWYRQLEDAVLALSDALPEGIEDYDARKLLEFQVGLRRAIAADAEAADERGEVELASIRMADVVRRISRRLVHSELDDPRVAADFIFATLPGIGVSDLSRLLAVSTKTVNAWKAGGPVTRNATRAVVIAQVLTHLRSSMTPVGLMMWFDAPRPQLDGSTPLQLLADDQAAARELLLSLARGVRGQLAS